MGYHTNPHFSRMTQNIGEIGLLDSLVAEQIAIHGLDILYMPRRLVNMDKVLNESPKSAFEFAMSIPMYLKDYVGYDPTAELLSKFGVRSSDQVTMVISRSQFDAFVSPFIKRYYEGTNSEILTTELSDFLSTEAGQLISITGDADLDKYAGQISTRPKEGDLIYFPYDDSIMEIKYVNFDLPFDVKYELQCEKFEYSGETFSTGYDEVDDTPLETNYYKLEFVMEEGGSSTFDQMERVTIYNLDGLENPGLVVPDPVVEYEMYVTSGLLSSVQTVTGKIYQWDKPNRTLVIGDLSNEDPTQQDELNNETVDRLQNVLVVGENSGAIWKSESVGTMEVASNDADVIQAEYDQIKVIDDKDINPFGFV